MQRSLLSGLTLLLTLMALHVQRAPLVADEIKNIWVAHRRVDCVGVGPQKCYLIKDTQYEDWRFWYGEIEGFEFEEGYAYELLVREKTIENPPADASNIELELVEVQLKVETFDGPAARPATPQPPATVTAPSQVAQPEPEPASPSADEAVESETIDAPHIETERGVPEPAASPVPVAAPTPSAEPGPVVEPEPVAQPAPTPEPVPEPPTPVETPAPAPPPPVSPQQRGDAYRGHLTIGSGIEARSFKLCGAEESIWVEDRTDDDLWGLYRRLSGYPNRPLFMEVEGAISEAPASGFGAHYSQQILIYAVRNASAESAGCFAEPTRFAFRASGNEPFWNIEISRQGLSFTKLGDDEILFPYSPPTFFGGQIIYRSQIRGQEARNLVVRLVEESCGDSMADATFSYKATVQIDDLELRGCARRGEDQP